MRFVREELKIQLPGCHPELVTVLREFELWSHAQELPEPIVVELWRTPRQQGDIYMAVWRSEARVTLQSRAAPVAARTRALEIERMTEDELRAVAEKKFSWHICRCAVDLRTMHYGREELASVVRWFQERCPKPMWELVTEKHGTGAHIHCARRAFDWRAKFSKQPEVPYA